MNTRLQVEHPVTEMITGLDLVEQQIKVAQGEVLAFQQSDLQINGHALELRVCAEDPMNDFLPTIGRIERYEPPVGPNIRVDDFVDTGYDIPIFYDNMIAKLIVWAPSRQEAIELMKDAINQYHIEGLQTTLGFGSFVLNHPNFVSADFDTQFVQKYFSTEQVLESESEPALAAAMLAVELLKSTDKPVLPNSERDSDWFANRRND